MYLPNPKLSGERNTKSKTELESHGLFMNLVRPGFEEGKSSRPKLSAIVMRSSVCME